MKSKHLTIALLLSIPVSATAVFVLANVKGPNPAALNEQREIYRSRPIPPPPVHRELVYRGGIFGRQKLDIYMPTTATPGTAGVPAVIFVHGGSWMHGDKEDIRIIDRFLFKMRAKGWAVVSINYVTSPFGLLEAPERNVEAALNWVKESGETYGINPDNIGLYSVSAGSHLVMTALVREVDPRRRWRFWLNEYGPVDLVAMANGEAYESSRRLARFPNRYLRKHSPILYVDRPFPPTLILHGDLDRAVAPAQSERLAETLTVHGTDVSLKIISGGDHGFFNMSQEDWTAMEDQVILFMERHFQR